MTTVYALMCSYYDCCCDTTLLQIYSKKSDAEMYLSLLSAGATERESFYILERTLN